MTHDQHGHDHHCDPDGFRASLESKLLTYGFSVVPIIDAHPPWAFTVGLERAARHPEICLSGLSSHITGYLLNALGREIVNGRKLRVGEVLDDVVRGHQLRVREVPRSSYSERFGSATAVYGDDSYGMLQLLWDDTDGGFPDDDPPSTAPQEVI